MPAAHDPDYPAIAIVGPTAAGKTVLGVALARRFRGEIVTCDAFQVYRHLDIGTAKPLLEERGGIPHHLIDLRAPADDFSAGDFQRLGRESLFDIRARHNIPFVVGGTGFYLRVLIDGLFAGPGRSEDLRRRLRRVAARRGAGCIHRLLRGIDPDTAGRLAPADVERNIRAYEIYLLTGETMSRWQAKPRDSLAGFRWLKLGIRWPRADLYERIERRVEEMFRHGFVAEVAALLDGTPDSCHALKAIGYRQVAGHLRGQWTLEQAIEDTKRESRRYAKRQLTWFRADPDIQWLDATPGPNSLIEQASARISAFLV